MTLQKDHHVMMNSSMLATRKFEGYFRGHVKDFCIVVCMGHPLDAHCGRIFINRVTNTVLSLSWVIGTSCIVGNRKKLFGRERGLSEGVEGGIFNDIVWA
jgi:hypothetical protein